MKMNRQNKANGLYYPMGRGGVILLLLSLLPFYLEAQPLASLNEGKHLSARKLRYLPDGEDFVILNGDKKFNRALYGGHSGFRLETGDVPEFALYLPRMGGNLSFGIKKGSDSIALNEAQSIESRYRPGSRIYTIKDKLLGNGSIIITALALPKTDGAIWKIEKKDTPDSLLLTWRFGGAADKRFSREGDLGVDPPDCFDLKPEYCAGNIFHVNRNKFNLVFGQTSKTGERRLYGEFPPGSKMKTDSRPVLHGSVALKGGQYILLALEPYKLKITLPRIFELAEAARKELASRVTISTPDPYLNTIGGALSVAADGIWDGKVWLHGAVGWRMALSGWRAAYTGDALGWHDRSRKHFDAYAASQVTNVPNSIPHPAQDPEMNFARSVKKWGTPQYSNGYICRNPNKNDQMHHYDMNLCYIDELLWHLNWTGDLVYAKKMWPVLKRHLAWEKQNYDPNDDGLYDAYACIWASDALYYNSGAVTHSTAYNYRANKMAAQIAQRIGEDPAPYKAEASKILNALNSRLWMPERGVWAEFQDMLGKERLHEHPGVWTVYHAIDSDISDPFKSYQATRYIDFEIPHIPVKAEGLKDEDYSIISTTNWMPYSWSINNVAHAEVMHTALAYFQADRNEEAFKLLKSSVLDGMYLGDSPGNFGQLSFYDAARGECYRDFGDPIGVASRAFVQGLFGLNPDAMNGKLLIRPGFPQSWDHAELKTPDITFSYKRENKKDFYKIHQRFVKTLSTELQLKARGDEVVEVKVNGQPTVWKLIDNSVGEPKISVKLPAEKECEVQIIWNDKEIAPAMMRNANKYYVNDVFILTMSGTANGIYDPQKVLEKAFVEGGKRVIGKVKGTNGYHTLFVKMKQGSMTWWHPITIIVDEKEESDPTFCKSSNTPDCAKWWHPFSIPFKKNKDTQPTGYFSKVEKKKCEPVVMNSIFNASVTDIFRNQYLAPRSPYTTLQIPIQGIGEWCHPKETVVIDDSGLRSKVENGVFKTTLGVPFRSPATGRNIAFTSLWSNYPDKISIPLKGKASRAYLMMAGSTNHMQCHIINGVVEIFYTDGTSEILELVNPQNWCPIEQDFYVDGLAFSVKSPRPYRLHLKSGLVSNNLERDLKITGVYGRKIDGGAGTFLEMELDPRKELRTLTLETFSNDVVIGLMGVTLQR